MQDDLAGTVVGDLDTNQMVAVSSSTSRLCIIASAGSGKTRVIVKRIEFLCNNTSLSPDQVVAITFTRKAGFELASRLSKIFPTQNRLRPFVGTLHSFVLNELSAFHLDNRTKMRTLTENPVSILTNLKISQPAKIARAISWCKTRMITPESITEDTMRAIRMNTKIAPRSLAKDYFVDAWMSYNRYCAKKSLMDHDDILIEYCRRLDNAAYLNSRQYLYRHLFIDEFQDTTPLHMDIYRRLSGENGGITVVGDPDQSIFSFAGSTDVYLQNFSDYFPGSQTVFLNTNYRSTRANVEVARSVVQDDNSIKEIFAPRPSGILPQLHAYSDEEAEAKGIMHLASSSHAKGAPLREIAVLVRTNAQKEPILKAAKQLGIPANKGKQTISDPKAAKVIQTIASLRKKRKWKSIYDALDDISTAQELDNATEETNEGNTEIYSKLRMAAMKYMDLFPHDRLGDVSGFFEYLESEFNDSGDKNGISVLTFHQSKGLEFNTVIAAGFEKGLVPLYNDKKRKREEARLAYVALSRATDELHITRASVRIRHSKPQICSPSEFLIPINEHISYLDIRNDSFNRQDAIKRISDIRAKYLRKKSQTKS